MDKKEAIREYKERVTPRGIFALRCTTTGHAWVELAPNLNSGPTAELFQLKLGGHRNAQAQAEWNEHGAESFTVEVLEKLDDELSEMAAKDALKARKAHWIEALGATRLSSR